MVSEDRKGLATVSEAAKAGNAAEATQLFHDWVNGKPGDFDGLPPATKSMLLDNARTAPVHLSAPPPVPLTCAQLGQLKVPVTITKGEMTRPFFRVLSEAAHRCIPGSQ